MTKNVKVIKIEDYPDRLFSLAKKRFEGGDFVGALSSLDSIKSYNKNGFKLTANAAKKSKSQQQIPKLKY